MQLHAGSSRTTPVRREPRRLCGHHHTAAKQPLEVRPPPRSLRFPAPVHGGPRDQTLCGGDGAETRAPAARPVGEHAPSPPSVAARPSSVGTPAGSAGLRAARMTGRIGGGPRRARAPRSRSRSPRRCLAYPGSHRGSVRRMPTSVPPFDTAAVSLGQRRSRCVGHMFFGRIENPTLGVSRSGPEISNGLWLPDHSMNPLLATGMRSRAVGRIVGGGARGAEMGALARTGSGPTCRVRISPYATHLRWS